MIEQTIRDIEAKIRAGTMSDAAKNELLQLLTKLRGEISALEKTSDTTREKLKVLKSPVEELRSSVEGFEQSHPKLVQTVNNISSALSNLGI
jgi:predicted  nucleic acid-binding Zn-ribbon protein